VTVLVAVGAAVSVGVAGLGVSVMVSEGVRVTVSEGLGGTGVMVGVAVSAGAGVEEGSINRVGSSSRWEGVCWQATTVKSMIVKISRRIVLITDFRRIGTYAVG